MTLVKWNIGRRNGNTSADSQSQTIMPSLFNSWLTTRVPSLFDNQLIQDLFDDERIFTGKNSGTSLPAVNINENADNFEIDLAAPGMKKNDFKIEMNGNQLRVSYNKENQTEGEQSSSNRINTLRREFNFESFERIITLPEMADGEKISATYEDGILKILVPKKEEARKKPARIIAVN